MPLYNILHTEWSPDGWGGQERRIIQECCKIRDLGHKVVLACQPGSPTLRNAKERGVTVEEVVMRRSIDPSAVWNLYRVIKRHGINVVCTHSSKDSWSASFAAKMAGVELLVRTRHVSVPVSKSPFNIVYRMPDGFITTGEQVRETMIGDNGISPARIVSIATGVSLARFKAADTRNERLRSEFGIPAGAPVVSMVAIIRSMKRYDLLVAAAKLLKPRFPEARFLVVGDGPGKESLAGLIRDAGLEDRVIMTGYRSDIPEILAISDVAVLTSDRSEGVPQSLSQAMSMGKPVVASPIGGITELVLDGKTGLLAQTGDASSFADCIGRLLQDEPLRHSLGEAARAHIIEGYTDDIMVKRTLEFYSQLREAKRKR